MSSQDFEQEGSRTQTRKVARLTDRGRLIVLTGPDAGRVHTLGRESIIGRDRDSLVIIDSPEVSRRHARIYMDADGWWLEDLGSRNGTLVNGVPVVGGRQTLRFGDRIHIAGTSVYVFSYYDQLEEQVLQLQRMESVGRLAGGIAHDFNNLLAAVIGTVDYLRERVLAGDIQAAEVVDCLDEMGRAAENAVDLTRSLLSFSRERGPEQHLTDVSEVVDDAVKLAQRTFPDHIRVDTKIDRGLLVLGSRTRLHQVVMNLCINARDAMPEGGQLMVRAEKITYAERDLLALPFLTPGPYVVLTVVDTGIGMDPETCNSVFEPFFTTKRLNEGTGLGLATVYGVVRSHGGHVRVESQVGAGSVFKVYLPERANEPVSVTSERGYRAVGRVAASSRRHVLLIAHLDEVRGRVLQLLEQLGYDALGATDAATGIALFEQHLGEVGAVVLTAAIPETDRQSTFAQLRGLDPSLPILLIGAGDLQPTGTDSDAAHRNVGVLTEPFDIAALGQALARAMAQSRIEDAQDSGAFAPTPRP